MPTPHEYLYLTRNIFSVNSGKEQKLKITHRDLPHWELGSSIYFVTFNTWEKSELSPDARQAILESCLFFDQERYQIFTMVVMPDHVHMLIQPWVKSKNEYWTLSSIMKSIKGYSAKIIPKVTNHLGIVWQDERYDRIVRDEEEFQNFWQYIRQNPVKAGLSEIPEDYPFFWQISSENFYF
ncbi:MAG: transposase [Leptolyngbyaceae cyanobacterium RM1_406_9]|nr:transposase [Leptolyngbyaceae cyanobacterium RM1_406_9]